MPALKRNLTLVVIPFLLTACFGIFEVYEFKSNEVDFGWGVVGAKLTGNHETHGSKTIVRSPYDLILWFNFNGYLGSKIQISELKLISSASGKIVFEEDLVEGDFLVYSKQPWNKYENGMFFEFSDLKLEFEDMELRLKYTLMEDDNVSKGEAVIIFEKNYHTIDKTLTV